MSETSIPEFEKAVALVYEHALAAALSGTSITQEQLVVYRVEHLMQETNSGASFDQYFRWADVDEIENIVPHLQMLGLDDVAALVRSAIAVAFPGGVPGSAETKSSLTDAWTEAQEVELESLFGPLEDQNARVMNVLGEYATRSGAVPEPGKTHSPANAELSGAEARHAADRALYDELGPEREGTTCASPGCERGTVAFSTLCRVHHFEQLWRRPCPFEH